MNYNINLPPPRPLIRAISDHRWAQARQMLLDNPNLQYCQAFDDHQQNEWTYFLHRTPHGFMRYFFRNNQHAFTERDSPLE